MMNNDITHGFSELSVSGRLGWSDDATMDRHRRPSPIRVTWVRGPPARGG